MASIRTENNVDGIVRNAIGYIAYEDDISEIKKKLQTIITMTEVSDLSAISGGTLFNSIVFILLISPIAIVYPIALLNTANSKNNRRINNYTGRLDFNLSMGGD